MAIFLKYFLAYPLLIFILLGGFTFPCPNPVLKAIRDDGVTKYIPCGKWSCYHCGYVKTMRLLDRVKAGFNLGGFRIRHFVLTEKKSPGSNHRDITKHWALARTALDNAGYRGYKFFWTKELKGLSCYYCKKSCEFAYNPLFKKRECSIDLTKYRHLHVLITVYVPKKLMESIWEKSTGGEAHIVRMVDHGEADIKNDIKNAAGYLSKYMTKEYREAPFDKYERRYAFSKGFNPITVIDSMPVSLTEHTWIVDFLSLPEIEAYRGYCTYVIPLSIDQGGGSEIYDGVSGHWLDSRNGAIRDILTCDRDTIELNRKLYPQYHWEVGKFIPDLNYPVSY